MAYFERALKVDINGKPVPQAYDPVQDDFIVLEGALGAAFFQQAGRVSPPTPLLDEALGVTVGGGQPVTGVALLVEAICPGPFTALLEGSRDGGLSWRRLPVLRLDDGSYAITTAVSIDGAYEVDIGGWPLVRARRSDAGGDPLTVA